MESKLIINRLKEHLGFNSDVELAKYLGVTQGAISSWKSRNSIDYDLIISKAPNADLNWLFRGEGLKQIVKSANCNDFAGEQVALYKDLYEKKCIECEAANQRLDNLIDKLGIFGGKLERTITMMNDSGENNYNGDNK